MFALVLGVYIMRVCGQHFCIILSCLHALVLAETVNRTIDDYFGDSVTGRKVDYSGYWNVGQTCFGCAIHPDANQAYAGTWHDVTSNYPNTSIADYVTIQFNGAFKCYVLPSQVR